MANKVHEQRAKKCGNIEIDKFFIGQQSDCIQRSRDTHSYGETWKQDDAASSSQVRLQDAQFGKFMDTTKGKLVGTQKVNQWMLALPNVEPGVRDPMFANNAMVKPMHPINQKTRDVQKLREEKSHNPHVSPATLHHTEEAFSIVREIYGHETLWMIWTWKCFLDHSLENHFWRSSSPWTRLWGEFSVREE